MVGLCCGCWVQDRTSAVSLMVEGEGGGGRERADATFSFCVIIYGFHVHNKQTYLARSVARLDRLLGLSL